ncbi:MAG TPA: sulfite exporter TauE/SafE family protein [Flavobacterium sp.]|nr:sulfite exporter TauE/SafE family protein [Flavobacterium sp.]
MEILGYITIFLAGISIGLIGAGGSILSVPILVYLFFINPVKAMGYSLFIVGTTSLVGVYPKYQNKEVSFKMAALFGVPSMISVFLSRKYLLPALPETMIDFAGISVSKERFLMLFFAVLMLFAARSVIKKSKASGVSDQTPARIQPIFVSLLGLVEGAVTGLVGAGGGFIIIPILVLYAKMPIKKAIGTSLLIIGVKSLIGFLGDMSAADIHINWNFLFFVTLLSICGMFVGNIISKKVDGSKLKRGFGVFILIMGVYILTKELFF